VTDIGGIRGLDSSVALHFLRILKELSRSTGMTNVSAAGAKTSCTTDSSSDRVDCKYTVICLLPRAILTHGRSIKLHRRCTTSALTESWYYTTVKWFIPDLPTRLKIISFSRAGKRRHARRELTLISKRSLADAK
jgi:hypothetical protein